MQKTNKGTTRVEVHDPAILAQAKTMLNACSSPKDMQEAVLAAVARNEAWRGKQCMNLLAPETPTSPRVRALLSAEVGIRAAEGHIGAINRWFAGTQHIDEIEALCVELLKKVFHARYADHRLVASMIVWDDPSLTVPITHAIFPMLAATHQVNRVAALAVSAAEMLAFGDIDMAQMGRNAQALAAALAGRGIPVLGTHKGYTRTHQVIADVRQFGGGLDVAQRLAQVNSITNKNLILSERVEEWDRPDGLRMGTIEVTRLGMHEAEMESIAEFMARMLIEQAAPSEVGREVITFRQAYQTLYYCFDNGLPPSISG